MDPKWGRIQRMKSMQEWYSVLGVGKGVPFREMLSVQGCPYRVFPL